VCRADCMFGLIAEHCATIGGRVSDPAPLVRTAERCPIDKL
jgi:hypothetical protein